MSRAFERGGMCGTADGNIIVLAGSSVGGGSTINWSASFSTPRSVLDDWESSGMNQFRFFFNIPAFVLIYFSFYFRVSAGGSFEDSVKAANELFRVNTSNSFRHAYPEISCVGDSSAALEESSGDFPVNRNNALLWKVSRIYLPTSMIIIFLYFE